MNKNFASLRLVDGAKLLHEFLSASHDGLATGLEHLAGIEALAFEVLAGLDVLTGGSGKDELQVGVHVDLGNAEGDGLLDLVHRDAGAAVENQRQVAHGLLDGSQSVEGQTGPILGVHAMDVADAAGEEVHAQSGDLLALLGVGNLALAHDTVLDATDAADLGLDGDALLVGDLHDLSGAVEVDLEGLLVGRGRWPSGSGPPGCRCRRGEPAAGRPRPP